MWHAETLAAPGGPIRRAARRPAALVALVVAIAGCDHALAPVVPPAPGVATVWLEVSPPAAAVGQHLTVRVLARAESAGDTIAALQGSLWFDPRQLRYSGQAVDSGTITLVNDAEPGRLRLAAVHEVALGPDAAAFGFEVLAPGGTGSLRFEPEVVGSQRLERLGTRLGPTSRPTGERPVRIEGRLGYDDWVERLSAEVGHGPQRTPGEYRLNLRYGDVTLDGAINVFDALGVTRLAVGINPLLTDATKDYVIAGNVAPANLPGLGEAGDAVPPGLETSGPRSGEYVIDVLDAIAVKREAVAIDMPVAGELIPGRGPAPPNRVIVTASIDSGVVRRFTADTIYEIHGMVNVWGWGRLIIEPGTRVEGDSATRGALVVRQRGFIDARGTRLEPIVMTCTGAAPGPGCWGGLTLNGVALLNNTDLPGFGCPIKQAPNSPGFYGGCQIGDSSGVLRYVRIEYAGQPRAGQDIAGLSLLGTGTATVVESVQVYGSRGHGLWISGGQVNLRYVVLTANGGDGLRWSDGWNGKAQYLIVQQDTASDHAIHGINVIGAPGTIQPSRPEVFNVTIVGPPPGGSGAGAGLLLEEGTAGILRNLVVLNAAGPGLDINGAETQANAAGGTLDVSNAVFFGNNPDYAADADGLDESAFASTPARLDTIADPQLIGPSVTRTADLRPMAGSPALRDYLTPPGGFFEPGGTFRGAVPAAEATNRSNIPWYAGWTRGWNGAP